MAGSAISLKLLREAVHLQRYGQMINQLEIKINKPIDSRVPNNSIHKSGLIHIKGLTVTYMCINFQPIEVVDRGSETQPQVVENLNN